MAYEHICRLDEKALALADTEIPALKEVIADYRQYLPEENWKAFQERVAREWAIETGQIEGLYQFDRGLTIELIEHGITLSRIPASSSQMSPEQVMAILSDHQSTLEGLFSFVKGERALSKSYIHEVHQALLRNQKVYRVFAAVTKEFFEKELVSGRYKDQPNSPTRPDGSILPFCPPEQVEAEMDQLMRFHREHEAEGVPVEIQAAWLHHAFTHIHPYPDGNGRVARALATLVLIKGGLMPLVVPTTEKQLVYIPALERADEHDYSAIVRAIRLWQARLVVDLSQRVEFNLAKRNAESLDEMLEGIRTDLLRKDLAIPPEWKASAVIAGKLIGSGQERFAQLAVKLHSVAQPDSGGWSFSVGGGDLSPWFKDESTRLGFAVESGQSRVLVFQTPVKCELRLYEAKFSPRDRGLRLLALSFKQDRSEELISHAFLVNFREDEASAAVRFSAWLEAGTTKAVGMWRDLNFG